VSPEARGQLTERPLVWWTAEELAVVDRAVKALIGGRFDSVAKAVASCRSELLRLSGPARGGHAGQLGRAWLTVYRKFLHRRHELGVYEFYEGWTAPELTVLDRYVRLLKKGRFTNINEAASAARAELARVHRARQVHGRPVPRRSPGAIFSKLVRLARAAGIAGRRRWTADEERVLSQTARALLKRRYPNLRVAALACRDALARLRRERPGAKVGLARGLSGIRDRIGRRARELGWSWAAARWDAAGLRILDGCARRLVSGGYATAHDAASECCEKLRQTQARSANVKRSPRTAPSLRTYKTILTYILRRSRPMGRTVCRRWTPEEDRIVSSFARGVIEGRFSDAPVATQACLRALAEFQGQRRQAGSGHMEPRTAPAVYSRICALAHGTGERWPKTGWTDEELRACRRWVRRYVRHRMVRRLRPWSTVGEGLQEELERLKCHRSAEACRQYVWREWRRQRKTSEQSGRGDFND